MSPLPTDHGSDVQPLSPHNALLLSGGGKWGAFGAGILNGWSETLGQAPEFDLVTGVSTGAILATHAFIGQPAPLRIYAQVNDFDVYWIRLVGSLFRDSLSSNWPLRALLEGVIGHEELLAVARKVNEQNARLLVGVVSLDTGKFIHLNLGEIARSYAAASDSALRDAIHRQYIDAILASTAIPAMLQPVYYNCEMMVDGGTRQQLFMSPSTANIARAEAATAREDGSQAAIYVLVNGRIQLNFGPPGSSDSHPAQPKLQDIVPRSFDTMLNLSLRNDIRRVCELQDKYRISVLSVDQVPAAEQRDCADQDNGWAFPTAFMSCLFDAGYRQGVLLGKSKGAFVGSCPRGAANPVFSDSGAR